MRLRPPVDRPAVLVVARLVRQFDAEAGDRGQFLAAEYQRHAGALPNRESRILQHLLERAPRTIGDELDALAAGSRAQAYLPLREFCRGDPGSARAREAQQAA